MSNATDKARRLRRDAERNRRLLVDAASEVFAEQGLDASLDEIARRAGVGNATLYRRFPTRADLYAAVYADAEILLREHIEQVLRIEDGWTALTTYCEFICRFGTSNRAACELMMAGASGVPSMSERRKHGEQAMHELVVRAQRQGSLRTDITVQDVFVALSAVGLMVPAASEVAPAAWRRQLALMLDGLRPSGASPLPPTPSLTSEQLHEIMPRLFLRRAR